MLLEVDSLLKLCEHILWKLPIPSSPAVNPLTPILHSFLCPLQLRLLDCGTASRPKQYLTYFSFSATLFMFVVFPAFAERPTELFFLSLKLSRSRDGAFPAASEELRTGGSS